MLLIEIIEWMWEHRGEVTLNAILLLILRKFVMSEVHKLLHLGREGELKWIRQKVEALTGEKYDGQQDFSKIVRSRYIAKSFFYLRKGIKSAYQKRRVKSMNQNINWATLVPCLLGAIKLILQPMGINIPDQNLNEIANGVAALATVIGIIYSHRKGSVPNVPTQSAATIGDNR